MFRIVVGVLAAFVGFSFGHSIPKWMEKKSRSAAETQSPCPKSTCPARKLPLRRKPLCKFKFGSQKPGKENLENHESLQQLSESTAGGHECLEGLQNSHVCARARASVHTEHKRLGTGSQKSWGEKRSFRVHGPSPTVPLSDVDASNGSRASTTVDNGCRLIQDVYAKSNIGHCPLQELHTEVVLSVESKLQEPVICRIPSVERMCGSSPPAMKEKSQMKQWKMKLMSLRSKAMASEKVWYEKFDSENYARSMLVDASSRRMVKKQLQGKENDSPQLAISNKKRELSWSRSSSKVGLLVGSPQSALER